MKPRRHPVPCRGCGYAFFNKKPMIIKRTFNTSGYCDECEELGREAQPESTIARRILNAKSAARRLRTQAQAQATPTTIIAKTPATNLVATREESK